jgi:integrase
VAPSDSSPASGSGPLRTAIDDRLRDLDGRYRRDSEFVLERFVSWLREERAGIRAPGDIDYRDARAYARHLRERVDDGEISASTATGPYWTIPRAFLGWCNDEGRTDENPMQRSGAGDPLPEDHRDPDRQFWSERDRKAILAHVAKRADESHEASTVDRRTAYRDRALVALLALSGVRGAEILREPDDPERDGVTWEDVEPERGSIEVFGKTREYQEAQVPRRAMNAVQRLRRVVEPPTADWPVFPTRHAPTLAASARDELAARGWEGDRIETRLDEAPVATVVREEGIVPPALTVAGGRSVMQRLCEDAGLDIDGEYLNPHGGRRGLGHQIYAESAELAQEALRHQSVETTHESYREVNVEETRERVEEILDGG